MRRDERHEVVPTNAQAHPLGLLADAGNAAVSAILQRQPQAGWSDADPAVDPAVKFSWNKERHSVGSIGRYPLQGLFEGNQEEWKGSPESMKLTTEGAKGKAIGLVPEKLKPEDPVTVFVLLHGYAESAKTRPYAGWRQHLKTHKVRDVEHDRIAQQIEATGDKQIIGILPQGGEKSQFGKETAAKGFMKPYNTFFTDAYIAAVLKELKRVGGLASVPTKVKVVVSAHSGGGHTVGSMLTAENEKRAGRPPGDHSSAPSSLGGVVLFDAMTWTEQATVKAWILGELDKLLAILTGPSPDKQKAIDDAPRFRGYYTLNESYVKKYEDLDKAIRGWFQKNAPALGSWTDKLWPLFQVIPWGGHAGETHETIIRGSALGTTPAVGNLTSALKAIKNPTARDPVPVAPPPRPRPRTRAKARAR